MPGGAHPRLTEHELQWHFTYAGVFNDPEIQEALSKHHERFRRKDIISAIVELKD